MPPFFFSVLFFFGVIFCIWLLVQVQMPVVQKKIERGEEHRSMEIYIDETTLELIDFYIESELGGLVITNHSHGI